MKIAVYPGSFDPPTSGHLDIIERAAKVFDLVYVGILENSSKNPLFSVDERVGLVTTITNTIENVRVASFGGLLVDFLKEVGARVIVKGLRNVSDYEYEFQMALLNQKLNPEYETLFLMTNSKYSYLSSSMIKELARLHGGLDELVPDDIIEVIRKKFKHV